jgi:hypothetical protein
VLPAVWERVTQFAGTHPFCDLHAKVQKDFGKDDSYCFWAEVKKARRSDTRPKQKGTRPRRHTVRSARPE